MTLNESNDASPSILPMGWQPTRFATLVYLLRDDEVLLIEKLRGHGAGKVNAPGGHIEVGETPEECGIREVIEEVGVAVLEADVMATLRFHDTAKDFDMLGYAMVTSRFTGEPRSSDEAIPFWVKQHEIPFDRMWEDDRLWLPRILAGERLDCELVFSDDVLKQNHIVKISQ
ncbi:MAG: 8-oxo-dGTP diphosphatase [Gammaproteobacteria bacterium]|nr:8-oxo-dGTP diphosphatase [Gammaproteobacteria bacterium]